MSWSGGNIKSAFYKTVTSKLCNKKIKCMINLKDAFHGEMEKSLHFLLNQCK